MAIAVDAVDGVRALPASLLHEVPPLLGDADRAAITRLGALDRDLMLIFEAARLLPDDLALPDRREGGAP